MTKRQKKIEKKEKKEKENAQKVKKEIVQEKDMPFIIRKTSKLLTLLEST